MSTASCRTLGELLTALKSRSGFSYSWLATKSGVSRASVHRYCNGLSLPEDFATAERIAKACSAEPGEMAELFRLWSAAVAASYERQDGTGDTAPAEDVPAAPEPGRRGLPRGWKRVAVGSLVALLTVVVVVAVAVARRSPEPDPGFVWSQSPVPVRSEFFGVTLNSTTGNMPGFEVGSVRLWDSGTRWGTVERRRGAYSWTILDRHVEGARAAGLPVVFTMGGTPRWASPDGPASPYSDSKAAPPDDLADWDRFVTALVSRYRGRIEAYELWVLANDPRFFNGSMETLVDMTRRAALIIRSADPAAKVICPSMGRLWLPEARQVMLRFAELGGYQFCDVSGVKLHQRSAADPPETMLRLARLIEDTFHRAAIHPPTWSTGTMYEIPLEGRLDPDRGAAYAVRFFLTGLAARYKRMYFYNWGGSKIPIVLQPDGGAPTKAARYLEQVQQWLHGAYLTGCGQGAVAELPDDVWQCRFTGPDRTKFVIRWSSNSEVRMNADLGATSIRRLDGTAEQLEAGSSLTVDGDPVLLTLR